MIGFDYGRRATAIRPVGCPKDMLETLLARLSQQGRRDWNYCAAPLIKGSRFQPNTGIAFIGRALNGWYFWFRPTVEGRWAVSTKPDSEREQDEVEPEELARRIENPDVCARDWHFEGGPCPAEECGPLHWINRPGFHLGRRIYKIENIGQFHRTARAVLRIEAGRPPCERWAETIAWGNLYPIGFQASPDRGANPNEDLMALQRCEAERMLVQRLADLKPRAVVVITQRYSRDCTASREGWAADFRRLVPVDCRGAACGCTRVDCGVVWDFRHLEIGARVIVTVRPERFPGKGNALGADIARHLTVNPMQ